MYANQEYKAAKVTKSILLYLIHVSANICPPEFSWWCKFRDRSLLVLEWSPFTNNTGFLIWIAEEMLSFFIKLMSCSMKLISCFAYNVAQKRKGIWCHPTRQHCWLAKCNSDKNRNVWKDLLCWWVPCSNTAYIVQTWTHSMQLSLYKEL